MSAWNIYLSLQYKAQIQAVAEEKEHCKLRF